MLLRVTRGARNPYLQVAITHVRQIRSLRSFGLSLRTNGKHRTQSNQAGLDCLSLNIQSRTFLHPIA